ncbi:MAG: penicillin-binding transpeptidase domain-containing protein [Ruminococcus sp.]
MKPIVMAAALEQGKISTSDTFYCDGYQNFGVPGNMTTIKCANIYGHGMETLAEVIANSCNDAMMQIGAKMGVENFLKAQSTFNFGSRTGIDLPNEGYGIMHTVDTMHETELACSAFGQGFSCTMIQEINAMCLGHQWRLLLSATSCDKSQRRQRCNCEDNQPASSEADYFFQHFR